MDSNFAYLFKHLFEQLFWRPSDNWGVQQSLNLEDIQQKIYCFACMLMHRKNRFIPPKRNDQIYMINRCLYFPIEQIKSTPLSNYGK